MMHRMLRFPSGWEWHVLHEQRPEATVFSRRKDSSGGPSKTPDGKPDSHGSAEAGSAQAKWELKREHPELAEWIDAAAGRMHNQIVVSELAGGEPVMSGTLMFQASEANDDIVPLHFWISPSKLFTLQADMRVSIRMQLDPWDEKLHRCETAPEAFFVMIGSILETLHKGLDAFELSLGELEKEMRRGNRTGLMNAIFERRYDLLHWNHLFIPIREIEGAAKEAFLSALAEREEFKRAQFKLDRIVELLDRYAHEIDTLLMMDEAIADFRGNDIMKTLTIFTALFTPATVIGSVWGMNFQRIPWSKEPWGFAVIALIIVVSTAAIYWWLWRKGWTGDLLHGRKPKDIVAPSAKPAGIAALPYEDGKPLPSRSAASRSPVTAANEDVPLPSRSRKA